MKNNFEILKLNNEPYDFLIIATSYENPLSSCEKIGREIKVDRAKLLFDLTLVNGVKKNRYIQCEYEAGKNQLQSCVIIDRIDEEIKKKCQDYFVENKDVVQKSVIPNALKYLVTSGMI